MSTQPTDPLRAEEVRLPSNSQKQGSSRLSERCAAVCDWAVQFHSQDIEEVGGIIYGSLLLEILKKAESHIARPPASRFSSAPAPLAALCVSYWFCVPSVTFPRPIP